MILSAHQPAYLPWLGYFEKIAAADVFVFLDDVQFEKNSFINRNRIKTAQGTQWLTIPIKSKNHTNSTLMDTLIDEKQAWRRKHLKAISLNYSKVSGFEEKFSNIETLISNSHEYLSEYCWAHLIFWMQQFSIDTKLIRSSTIPKHGRKSDLILDICKRLGATKYLSGSLGRDYLVESDFTEAGIEIAYQSFNHPIYPQLWGDFTPFMSVVDAWMNTDREYLITALGRTQ